MAQRYKYGVLAAGAVSASFIGRLPGKVRELGPVSGISYRVASRIANTLRAGYPVRTPDELDAVPCVLLYSPSDQLEALSELLERASINWIGKALIFCDCFVPASVRQQFQHKGASTAVVRESSIPGHLIVEGNAEAGGGAALKTVHRLARELHTKSLEIAPDSAELFEAAVTLGSAALTPMIDAAVELLRKAGVRDIEAARLASSLFERTARDYAHSGKQSWAWYVRGPEIERLEAQIAGAGRDIEPLFRELLLFGLERFDKHRDARREVFKKTDHRNSVNNHPK